MENIERMLLEKKDFCKDITFDNVFGYDELKNELKLVASWWNNRNEINKKGIDIPHGILLYGKPGTGKSLIEHALINLLDDCKVILIDGKNTSNESDEIIEKFSFAKSLDKLVVVCIEEIDILARSKERQLLNELDVLNSNSNVFIIATCNDVYAVSDALKRRDRLDYIIKIGLPNEEDRKSILKSYFTKSNIISELDYDYLGYITYLFTAADLKAVANETLLRFGNNPTNNHVESVVDMISKRSNKYYGEYAVDYMTAVHEVGHAVVAYLNDEYFKFYKATLESTSTMSGLCKVFPTNKKNGDYNRIIADIEISIAGHIACKKLFNYSSEGAINDLEKARNRSAYLVNTLGYKGLDKLLSHELHSFKPSNNKMVSNEKNSAKILYKCEKRVNKIVKKYKKEIIELANILYDKKTITSDDIKEVMNKK